MDEAENLPELPIKEKVAYVLDLLRHDLEAYPLIIQNIYDPLDGWIDFLQIKNNVEDYGVVYTFLSIDGPIFSLIEKSVKLNYVYNYDDIKWKKTNAYEFYFLCFFNYIGQLQKFGQDSSMSITNSIYLDLAKNYLSSILTIPYNYNMSTIPAFKNHHVQYFISHLSQEIAMTQDLIGSDINHMYKSFFATSNYNSLAFVVVFINSCLLKYNNQKQNLLDSGVPSINEINLVRTVLLHLMNFCELKSPAIILVASSNVQKLTFINQSPQSIFRSYLFPLMLRDAFQDYYESLFATWPLLPSFHHVLTSWFTFIQPWRYVENIKQPEKAVIFTWKNYLIANYKTYCLPLQLYLKRVCQLPANDLIQLTNSYQLHRVLRTFTKGDLYLLLRQSASHVSIHNLDSTRSTAFERSSRSFVFDDVRPTALRLAPILFETLVLIENTLNTYDNHINQERPLNIESSQNISTYPHDIFDFKGFLDEMMESIYRLYSQISLEKRILGHRILLELYQLIVNRFLRDYVWYHVKFAYYCYKYRTPIHTSRSSSLSDLDHSSLFIDLMARGNSHSISGKPRLNLNQNGTINSSKIGSPIGISNSRNYTESNNLFNDSFTSFLSKLDSKLDERANMENLEQSYKLLIECLEMLNVMFGPVLCQTYKPPSPYKSNEYNFRSSPSRTSFALNSTNSRPQIENLSPELAPVRSYENAFLVRALYRISKFITFKTQTQIYLAHLKPGLLPMVLRVVLWPFVSWRSSLDYYSPGKSGHLVPRKISQQPYVDLRFLANYHFWGFILFLSILLAIYGLTLNRLILWVIVFVAATALFDIHQAGLNDEKPFSQPYAAFNGQTTKKLGLNRISSQFSTEFQPPSNILLSFVLFGLICYLFYSILPF